MPIVDRKNKKPSLDAVKAPEIAKKSATKQSEGATPDIAPKATKPLRPSDKLAAEGATIRSQLTEEQKALEGIWSEHVTRVRALTANKFMERTVINKVESFEPAIVGYVFMADIPLEGIAKADGDTINVPANTEFILTRQETGEFFSRPEMGGMSSDSRLTVRYNKSKGEFTPLLNDTKKRAVKANSVTIDTVEEVDGVRKCKVLPEYEDDFGFLYVRKTGGCALGTGGRAAKDAERQKNLAAGLFALYQAKKKAQG